MNVVENDIAQKIDAYFKAKPDVSGNYWRVKTPWTKYYRWLKSTDYFQFRYDLATQLNLEHLNDLARAVGLLEGLGHPDARLTQRYETMLASITAPTKAKGAENE